MTFIEKTNVLQTAIEIEKSKTVKYVLYVDVGNLPTEKAQKYLKATRESFNEQKLSSLLVLSNRVKVEVLPYGDLKTEDVLATYRTLSQELCI